MQNEKKIGVEVAYARPDVQVIIPLDVERGTTVEQAIELSGIREQFPDIQAQAKIGIFGKLAKKTETLRDGDRVEIYRPLLADPKEVRRRRAAEGKKTKKGGGDL